MEMVTVSTKERVKVINQESAEGQWKIKEAIHIQHETSSLNRGHSLSTMFMTISCHVTQIPSIGHWMITRPSSWPLLRDVAESCRNTKEMWRFFVFLPNFFKVNAEPSSSTWNLLYWIIHRALGQKFLLWTYFYWSGAEYVGEHLSNETVCETFF